MVGVMDAKPETPLSPYQSAPLSSAAAADLQMAATPLRLLMSALAPSSLPRRRVRRGARPRALLRPLSSVLPSPGGRAEVLARAATKGWFQRPGMLSQLWNQWEIQILVVLSFMLQVFLFFTSSIRRRSANRLLRFFTWIAYLCADWVAIYALGIISRSEDLTTKEGALRGAPPTGFHLGFLPSHPSRWAGYYHCFFH